MDTAESPPGVPLPHFLTPDLQNSPWSPEEDSQHPESKGTGTGRSGRSTPRPGHDGPPTPTSSTGDIKVKRPDPEAVTALAIGVLGLVVAGATWLVRQRTHRKLRQPTKRQSKDIATPLAEMLTRHGDLSWLHPDLGNLIEFGSAVGVYLNDGDLLEGPADNPGLPVDLNEEYAS